ncbi:MAG: flagellar motor switch protein FliM [Gammaproteobacteria bacterium]
MAGADILSQDEIDALLNGVDGGDVETEVEEEADNGEAKGYDFNSQDRIVRGRLPTLEMINERFARNFRVSLFNILRRSPEIVVEGIEMMKFGEYIHTLFMPSNMNMVKMNPLRGTSLFVLNPKLVYSLVDNFFGGSGRFHTKIEGREFSATEMRIVMNVLDQIFIDLGEAWKPVMEIDHQYLNSEVNPQFANVVSPSEVMIISNFHVDLDGDGGSLQIAMPYSTIEPIREMLDAGIQSDASDTDERWVISLREELNTATLELSSTLTTKQVSLRDVLAMQTGDIVPVDIPDNVIATVEGVPVLKARFGESRGNCALKVDEVFHGGL